MIKDLKLVVLNGSKCSEDFNVEYNEAYSHWLGMWKSTFNQLDGDSHIFSDNFTRQDDVLGLFYKGKCIAMVCHRYINFNMLSHFDDSYFETWPQKAKDLSIKMKGTLAIGNQISIDPAYRKLSDGISTKDILLWFSLKHLSTKNISNILGSVREDKSLDKLFSKFGARILESGIVQHNVPVALIYIKKEEIKLNSPELPLLDLNKIYNNRYEDLENSQQSNFKTRRVA